MMIDRNCFNYIVCFLFCWVLLFFSNNLHGQTINSPNIKAKAFVLDESTIKIRWAPTNTKSWVEGNKYGYTVERYTIMTDNLLLDKPHKQVIGYNFKPMPLAEWGEIIESSEYAAVIAQSFFGEDFELSVSSSDIGAIINQANELEQRFSTSLYMADLDFKAAEFAGWGWIDNEIKDNEKYLYRIYLNRPESIQGDTAAVYISTEDYIELPQPVGLAALFGDCSVLLSWNYNFQSEIYPAYHIERKSSKDTVFQRVTEVPVTVLTGEMNEIFYTDSLDNNEEDYSYRVVGITCFDKEGPVSDIVTGKGRKTITCIPHISGGDFISNEQAHAFWELDCPEIDFVQKFQLIWAETPNGQFRILADSIHVSARELIFSFEEDRSYLKLLSVHKDGTTQESHPFLLQKIDSIPPAIPIGLKVVVDTTGIAHLTWNMNEERDVRGYRILRSFTLEEEKTSINPDLIVDCEFRDSLSFALGNEKVYYSLTALDMRYNESSPCEVVVVDKPSLATPDEPVFSDYQIIGNAVKLNWLTDKKRDDVYYSLLRYRSGESSKCDTIYTGGNKTMDFTDEIIESGIYQYIVTATDLKGRKSISPQKITVEIIVQEELNQVSNFSLYADREKSFIELSWRKHKKAHFYRLYRSEDNLPMELWRETDSTNNRIVDESVSPNTRYTYTILFVTDENRTSKPKMISINY